MELGFKLVTIEDKEELQKIYDSYCLAFPEEERRNEQQFLELFTNDLCSIFLIEYHQEKVGYFISWNLTKGLFLEHLEIFPDYRGKKIGAAFLQKISENNETIILESEPESYGEIAKKRLEFYKRNGFIILDFDYIQPAYESSKSSISLNLLATKPFENTSDLIREIHKKVYLYTP